ncbi:unnamed protein product [Prorocentrum cordatum]|uniref:Uncharacterized protein n=1 Tax=Prorocentrum cordatum TaxID=2364126 RepID=A0ABN9YBQ1_9DINO|nr:unnamed protein product [Polarella glacialis]
MMGTPRRWMTTTELANTNAQIIVSARSASATPRALGGARPSTPGTPRSPPGAGSTSRSYASSSASAGSARSLSGMIAARCIMGEAGCDKALFKKSVYDRDAMAPAHRRAVETAQDVQAAGCGTPSTRAYSVKAQVPGRR